MNLAVLVDAANSFVTSLFKKLMRG